MGVCVSVRAFLSAVALKKLLYPTAEALLTHQFVGSCGVAHLHIHVVIR